MEIKGEIHLLQKISISQVGHFDAKKISDNSSVFHFKLLVKKWFDSSNTFKIFGREIILSIQLQEYVCVDNKFKANLEMCNTFERESKPEDLAAGTGPILPFKKSIIILLLLIILKQWEAGLLCRGMLDWLECWFYLFIYFLNGL